MCVWKKKEPANDCIPTIRIHSECNGTITTNTMGDVNDCTPKIRMYNKCTNHRTSNTMSDNRTADTTSEVVATMRERP